MKPTKEETKIVHDLLDDTISIREAARQLGITRNGLNSIILKVYRYETGNN